MEQEIAQIATTTFTTTTTTSSSSSSSSRFMVSIGHNVGLENSLNLFINSNSQLNEQYPTSQNINYWSILHLLITILLCLVSLFVVLGNSLVVGAIWHENQLHSVTNYLIASLAVADCLVGLLVMPFSIISENIMHSWRFGATWCDLWHSFDVLASTASIMNLCAISLDRYLAITDPISYPARMTPKRVALLIVSLWTCSALISFPAIIWWRSVSQGGPLVPIVSQLTTGNMNINFKLQQQQHQQPQESSLESFESVISSDTFAASVNKQFVDEQSPSLRGGGGEEEEEEEELEKSRQEAKYRDRDRKNQMITSQPLSNVNHERISLAYQGLIMLKEANETGKNKQEDEMKTMMTLDDKSKLDQAQNFHHQETYNHQEEQLYKCVFTDDTYYLLFSSFISFYGPLCVMLYAYYRIYKAAVKQMRFLKHGSKQVMLCDRMPNGANPGSISGETNAGLILRAHRGGGAGSGGGSLNLKTVLHKNNTSTTTTTTTTTTSTLLASSQATVTTTSSSLIIKSAQNESQICGANRRRSSLATSTTSTSNTLPTFAPSNQKQFEASNVAKSNQVLYYEDGKLFQKLSKLKNVPSISIDANSTTEPNTTITTTNKLTNKLSSSNRALSKDAPQPPPPSLNVIMATTTTPTGSSTQTELVPASNSTQEDNFIEEEEEEDGEVEEDEVEVEVEDMRTDSTRGSRIVEECNEGQHQHQHQHQNQQQQQQQQQPPDNKATFQTLASKSSLESCKANVLNLNTKLYNIVANQHVIQIPSNQSNSNSSTTQNSGNQYTSFQSESTSTSTANNTPQHNQQIAATKQQNRKVGRKLTRLAKERKAAKTLGIVVGVFILCWLPYFVMNITLALRGSNFISNLETLFSILTWLGWLNSAMNPVIYACWSREFRRAFRRVLCSWVIFFCPYGDSGQRFIKKLKLKESSNYSSNTNATSSQQDAYSFSTVTRAPSNLTSSLKGNSSSGCTRSVLSSICDNQTNVTVANQNNCVVTITNSKCEDDEGEEFEEEEEEEDVGEEGEDGEVR